MSRAHLPASPYKGLAAFEASDLDALFFFGRERDSKIIAANLIASRLTVLFGPTGVGKTSVLRAGVAYQLRREAGVEVVIHSSWTASPADALTRAAAGTAGDLYIILDQFEEFFLYHQHDRAFVEGLAELVGRSSRGVNVLIGIREDALAQLDSFKGVIPSLLSNRLGLQRLDRAAGRSAILGPVRRFNELAAGERHVEVEPELAEAVLDEVAAGRVELGTGGRGVVTGRGDTEEIEAPYLQLVMARIWEVETESGSETLRRETLRELGGATQIVHDHLERAMDELTPRQKDAAAAMYHFLVTPSGTKIAHDVSDLAGYAEIDETDARNVLRRLADERIVRANAENGAATRYEIYHDVLADAVVAWRNRHGSERALREAERRRRRALFVATAALAGLLLIGAIAVYALVERSHSRADARRAHARELTAAAISEMESDPQNSVRLAVQSARLEPGVHEEDVLRQALLAAHQRAVLRADGPVRIARFDPLGRWIATGSLDGKARVYRVGSGSPELVLDQGGPVTSVEYSRDGRILLTAGREGTARLWSRSGKLLRKLGAGGPVTHAFFNHDSRRVVTLTRNGVIRVWAAADGSILQTIRVGGKALPTKGSVDRSDRLLVIAGRDRFARVYSIASGGLVRVLPHEGRIHCAAFSPDGSRIMTCGHEGTVRIWSAAFGRLVRQLGVPRPGRAILDGVFSPNGILVAGGVADGTARVWETPRGIQVGLMFGHVNPVTAVAFNASGRSLVTGSADTRVRTWRADGHPTQIMAGHEGSIAFVAFSPDGRWIVTASDDGTARLWASGTEPDLAVVARQAAITAFALSGDGKRVIVGDARGIARVRSVGRRRVLTTLRRRGPVTAVAFGPRGAVVATRPTLSLAVWHGTIARGKRDGSVVLRGADGRRRVFATGGGAVTAVAFSPDGQQLATGGSDGVARVWQLRTGREVGTFSGHRLRITSVGFSPDGVTLLTASQDHQARTWNVRTGKLVHTLLWHFGPVSQAAFSSDGRWIVTAGPSTVSAGTVSGKRFLILRGHSSAVVGAAFAGSQGRLIVTAGRDGTIRTYRCDICGDVGELISVAQRRLRRS